MTLPTLSVPTFDVEVYSTKQTVRMRPFLVKEEKILILAAESNSKADMIRAMQQVITSCADNQIDAEKLPFFDLQNIFIKLRAQSIGNESEFNLICGECGHKTPTILKLDQIELQTNEEHTQKILLADDIGVIMKYPTADILTQEDMPVFDMVAMCVDKIFTQNEVHSAEEEGHEAVCNFLDGLTSEQFDMIAQFFVTSPKIYHRMDYICSKCETDNSVVIDGVENFFG
jgi:hypothetical protein